MFLLSLKIGYYSVFKNSDSKNAVNAQSSAKLTISNKRKPIFDRNGIPLTEREISVLHLTKNGTLSSSEFESFKSFPFFKRYSSKTPATHILGYISDDGKGLSGIEKYLDEKLKTPNNLSIEYESDALGRPLNDGFFEVENPNPSPNGIKLTIDYHIQKIAENVMDEYIQNGSAVIIDTKTFEILAMVSRPDFSKENIPEAYSQTNSPLLNRALCAYNAGSIYKIVTAAAILEKDFNYLNSYFYCSGQYPSANEENHVFHCHKKDGHGYTMFSDGFAKSCNCTFFEAGKNLGAENLVETAKKLGFGTKHLKIGSEEASGNVMEKSSYTENDILNMSIGQGEILVTPLQCAVMTATVANGGMQKAVSIVKNEKSQSSQRVISPSVAGAVASMMRHCVLWGTGASAAGNPLEIAGKTGSAETGWLKENSEYAVHGWFCGFFPYSAPKYAMVIFCEDGKSGAASCVEPFSKICEEINKIYPIKQ